MKAIVIGGGISGLAAACKLLDAGVEDFLLLEARDRIGGRITQAPEFDLPIDLGASWIHGTTGNPVLEIANSLGLRLDITNNPNLTGKGGFQIYHADGTCLSETLEVSSREKFEMLLEKAKVALSDHEEDISLGHLLQLATDKMEYRTTDEEKHVLNWIKSGIEGWENTNLDQLSARNHFTSELNTGFEGGDAFIIDGYFRIVNMLAKRVEAKIRLSHIVSAVEQDEFGVRVQTNMGAFEADYVLCTLPLGVLKAGMVQFVPSLPQSKQRAIDRMGFGLMNKIVLQFPETFWEPKSEGFGFVSTHHGEFSFFMNLTPLTEKPVLMCFIAADFAHEVEEWTDEQIMQRIMTVLNSIYGKEKPVPTPLVSRITRWKADPYARGSYSFFGVGATQKDVKHLGKPFGRIHFSGEATFKCVGYAHGGYITGVREAEAIAEKVSKGSQ